MRQAIAEYFKTQPVLKAWLFGSFARGEETPGSDVDILVLLDYSKLDGFGFFGMWGDLERLLNRKVDLVTEAGLAPYTRANVERDKQLIYERNRQIWDEKNLQPNPLKAVAGDWGIYNNSIKNLSL